MKTNTVVLGLGNTLYGDEGIGVRVAEFLYRYYDFYPDVTIVNAGTQGVALWGRIEKAKRVLILDAVDFSLRPGTVLCKKSLDIANSMTMQKRVVRQGSFFEILALASLCGKKAQDISLVAMQPVQSALGAAMSDAACCSGLPLMVTFALQCIKAWGIVPCLANLERAEREEKDLHQLCNIM